MSSRSVLNNIQRLSKSHILRNKISLRSNGECLWIPTMSKLGTLVCLLYSMCYQCRQMKDLRTTWSSLGWPPGGLCLNINLCGEDGMFSPTDCFSWQLKNCDDLPQNLRQHSQLTWAAQWAHSKSSVMKQVTSSHDLDCLGRSHHKKVLVFY